MRYKTAQCWLGWWGGFGDDNRIQSWLNLHSEGGHWELVDFEIESCWWLLLIPRNRMLAVFKRTE